MRRPEPPAASIVAAALASATSSIDLAPDASDRPWQPQTSAAGEILAAPPHASATPHDYTLPATPALASGSPPAAL
ncbi:TolC family protein, partial [Burkholderia multivorans]